MIVIDRWRTCHNQTTYAVKTYLNSCVEMFIRENNKRGVNQSNQATPSIWAWGKSSSGIRVVIMAAFPRIKLREYLWNRCEVAIDST